MRSTAERFWAKVTLAADDACWLWTRGTVMGYGFFHVGMSPEGVAIKQYAHRWSYEQAKGPIPEGLTIDHLCRVRRCVNPAHLEAVTIQENLARTVGLPHRYDLKPFCGHGHERTAENTRFNRAGRRVCIPCAQVWAVRGNQLRTARRRSKSLVNQ